MISTTPVHPGEVDADAAVQRADPAFERRAGTEGDDGDTMAGARGDDGGDLLRGGRERDGFRWEPVVEALVSPVVFPHGHARDDAVGTECLAELVDGR